MNNDILVMDIETQTFGKPDVTKDKFKIFGCYSYKTNKIYLLTDKEQIQKVINTHKFLVGFNNKEYDNPILQREGFDLQYKIIIDLRQIFKSRAGEMKIKEGMLKDLLMRYSLDYITKTLGIVNEEEGKIQIDYNLFKKDSWTKEEIKLISDYTKRDIEVTKKLYEWVEKYFESFKAFLTDEDVRKKTYLTDKMAVFTYKVMCKELGVSPDFDIDDEDNKSYTGGYVAYPTGEHFSNNLALFDYSSLYPNIFIQCNLFTSNCKCCTLKEKWSGSNFFKINGSYCSKELGKIEKIYKKFFVLRKKCKEEKNPFEYVYKILLNSGYGITANPKFKHLYNKQAASDCTAIGRDIILYTRKRFREEGYSNVMSDTDSICIQFPEGKKISDAVDLSKKIVLEIQQYMPFAW